MTLKLNQLPLVRSDFHKALQGVDIYFQSMVDFHILPGKLEPPSLRDIFPFFFCLQDTDEEMARNLSEDGDRLRKRKEVG